MFVRNCRLLRYYGASKIGGVTLEDTIQQDKQDRKRQDKKRIKKKEKILKKTILSYLFLSFLYPAACDPAYPVISFLWLLIFVDFEGSLTLGSLAIYSKIME